MWFLLRLAFWLGVVLVILPSGGSQHLPKSQISAGEAFSAARVAVTDMQHFCERQPAACEVGSQTAVTLGQRAQAGAKILYEFLHERFGGEETASIPATGAVPLPRAAPSQHTLQPADMTPPWRGPQPPRNARAHHPA